MDCKWPGFESKSKKKLYFLVILPSPSLQVLGYCRKIGHEHFVQQHR